MANTFALPDEEEAFMTWYGNTYKTKGWPSRPSQAPVDAREAFLEEQDRALDGVDAIPVGNIYNPKGKALKTSPEPGENMPSSFDFGESKPEGDTDTLPSSFDFSGGQLGATKEKSKGFLETVKDTYLGHRPDWSQGSPEPPTDPLAIPGYLASEVGKTGLNLMSEVMAPLATIRDYTFGLTTGKPGQPVSPKEIGDIFKPTHTSPLAGVTDSYGVMAAIPGMVEGLAEMAFPMRGGTPRPAVRTGSPKVLDTIIHEQEWQGPPQPTLRQLAEQHQSNTLTGYVPPAERGGGTVDPLSGIDKNIGMTGTGSVTHSTELPSTAYPGPAFGENSSGSLVRRYNPEEVTATGPHASENPGFPSLKEGPKENNLDLTSKPLHGKPAEGPPAPGLKSAEDLLAEKQAKQQALFDAKQKELEATDPIVNSAKPIVKDPTTLQSLPPGLNNSNTAGGAIFPNWWKRTLGGTLDAMKQSGPINQGVASLIEWAYESRATLNGKAMSNLDARLGAVLETRGVFGRAGQVIKGLAQGENAFLAGLRKKYKFSEAEEESLFNYMYTQGRMEPMNDRVRQVGDILYEEMLYPVSSDPAVQKLFVTNPFTLKKTPVGAPSRFLPQQPIREITKDSISHSHWKRLYERAGGQELGVTLEQYRDTIVAMSRHDPEVAAARMKGMENARILDLEIAGESPYQLAKKLGYQTDPYKASFVYNSMGNLRARLADIEEPINKLLLSLPEKSLEREWAHKIVSRAMLHPGTVSGVEAPMSTTVNALKVSGRVADMTMLQQGGLANMAQVNYVITRGGAINAAKGLKNMLTGADAQVVQKSGALFPAAMNEFVTPTGAMATFASGTFRLYGLSQVDRFTRYFAGHVGNTYIKSLTKELLSNPANKAAAKQIDDLGGSAKSILEMGSLPEDMQLKMIQRFANRTAGITDLRGIPYWATSENPWIRVANKYRTFSLANSAEMRRLAKDSPDWATFTKRAATFIASSYAVGTGIDEVRKGIRDGITALAGGQPPKDKKGWHKHVDRLLLGMGGIEGIFLVQAMESNSAQAVLSAVGGPLAGVGASLLQDLVSTVKHGIGWRSVDTASKRLPLVGPVVGPAVGVKVRRESAQEAERQRELSDEGD